MDKFKNNIKVALSILLVMFILLASYMCYALFFYGDRWFSSPYNTRVRISSAQPKIIIGDILDRNNTLLATTKEGSYKDSRTGKQKEGYYRQYSDKTRYLAHVVGYHSENGRSGAEAFHIKYLMGYNNHIFERIYQKAFLPKERGNNILLTVDIELGEYISKLLNGKKGSVVLMNPKTGEILSMVSSPSFDPNDISGAKSDDLIDRSVDGLYPPGSIFKIITAAAALENIEDIKEWRFNCTGKYTMGDKEISCYNSAAHGEVDLAQALILSCNGAFAELASMVGWQSLLNTSEQFGFNKNFLFPDLKISNSKLNLNKNIESIDLGWTSVGQGKTLVTPMHMAMVASAIANDGIMVEPKLLHSVVGRGGAVQKKLEPKSYRQVMDPDYADFIKKAMARVVSEGTGRSANVGGISIAGKTGTAETKSDKDSTTAPHAWFIGFAPVDEPTLAVAVIIENSGTGGKIAAPIAGKVLKKAREMGY